MASDSFRVKAVFIAGGFIGHAVPDILIAEIGDRRYDQTRFLMSVVEQENFVGRIFTGSARQHGYPTHEAQKPKTPERLGES